MKRIFILSLIILFVFSGCQGYREIDSEYLVSAICFDKNEDGDFSVFAEVLAISPEKKDTKSKVFDSKGDTPYEAVNNIASLLPRTAVFDHCGTAIISKSIIGDDLKTIMKYLYDTKNLNLGIYVFVSDDIKSLLDCESQALSVGYDIMAVISNIEKTSGIRFKNKYYEIESQIIANGGFCLPVAESKENHPCIAGQTVFVDYIPQTELSKGETVFYNLLMSGSTGGAISVSGKRCRTDKINVNLSEKDNLILVNVKCCYRNKNDIMNKQIENNIKKLLNKLKGTAALKPLGISNKANKVSVVVTGNEKR